MNHRKGIFPLLTAGIALTLFPACNQGSGRDWGVASPANGQSLETPIAAATAVAAPCVANLLAGTVTASSQENSATPAYAAADGTQRTRWSSQFSDPQWLRFDFGAQRYIGRVTIQWEAASSKNYTLQTSNDGNAWTTLKTVTNGPVGPILVEHNGLNAIGRYLRLYSTARNTVYGISIFEMGIYGDVNPSCTQGSVCGNGAVETGEQCDDGNTLDNDGCSATCQNQTPSWYIASQHSTRALEPAGGNGANGTRIEQWSYDGRASQKWNITPGPAAAQFQIRNVQTGKCIDIAGPSALNGAAIHQWDCHAGLSQKFSIRYSTDGQQIVSAYSGKCLDVADFSMVDGGRIQQWTCGTGQGGYNQKWNLAIP
jgi:cysteine-rich repeat protein